MEICLLLATSAPLAARGVQLDATQSGDPAACPRGPRHDCFLIQAIMSTCERRRILQYPTSDLPAPSLESP
eukprot:4284975-Pyramimonas_sp.AAC.1